MTRKDYVEFAKEINELVRIYGTDGPEYGVIREMVNSMCGVFRRDNSRFNRDRFLTAAGIK